MSENGKGQGECQRIKQLRLLKGYRSQKAFGESLRVTHGQIGNWERGGHIAGDRMLQIAAQEGVSLDWLRYGRGEMNGAPLAASRVFGGSNRSTATSNQSDRVDVNSDESFPVFAAQEITGGCVIVSTDELAVSA